MQAVTKNPRDAMVVAKVLRRNSSLSGLGEYFFNKRKDIDQFLSSRRT
jgi:hypothetical protein